LLRAIKNNDKLVELDLSGMIFQEFHG